MNLSQTLPLINIIGFLSLGGAIVFTQWRLGKSQALSQNTQLSAQVITTYKDRVQQLIDELQVERDGRAADRHELTNQIQVLSLKIAKMEGENGEKDKKIMELTAIIQGKDPVQVEYMDSMKKVGEQALAFIKRSDDREDKIFKALADIKGR